MSKEEAKQVIKFYETENQVSIILNWAKLGEITESEAGWLILEIEH